MVIELCVVQFWSEISTCDFKSNSAYFFKQCTWQIRTQILTRPLDICIVQLKTGRCLQTVVLKFTKSTATIGLKCIPKKKHDTKTEKAIPRNFLDISQASSKKKILITIACPLCKLYIFFCSKCFCLQYIILYFFAPYVFVLVVRESMGYALQQSTEIGEQDR